MAGNASRLTTQDGTDHTPGWYYPSFPKALREEYEKTWHEENDARLAKEGAETLTFRAPGDYRDAYAHMRNFLDAVRTRKPVVEDAVFGNYAAIAGHRANASYLQKSIARWDASPKNLRT